MSTATGSVEREEERHREQAPERDEGANDEIEHPKERRNRELIELLNELRVALPGVQVLFAFLLTLPLSSRFEDLKPHQEIVYFATFLAAALATALLMTPTAYHRLRFRQADKERLLRISNRAAITGLGFLVAAIAGAVFLISDLLFQVVAATVVVAIVAGAYVVLWFVLPITRHVREGMRD